MVKVVALDRALEALAFADALHVDLLANREDLIGLDFAAHGKLAEVGRFHAEFPKTAAASTLALA
jgi:hypothetical protein